MLLNGGTGKDSLESLGLIRRSNQSILKKINPECSSEGLMLKPEAPTLWPPDAKSHSLEKTLRLGKIEGKRRRVWKWIRW